MGLHCSAITGFHVLGMKNFAIYIFLSFYLVKAICGDSVVVNAGETLLFSCYDVQITKNLDEPFYLDLFFQSIKPDSSNELIGSYKPETSQFLLKNSDLERYEGRLTFNSKGQGQLTAVTLTDEGIFTCTAQVFAIIPQRTFTTTVVVFVAPTVRLQNVVTPLQADISQTAVAECSAAGGKPPPEVVWRSLRQFKFFDVKRNSTTPEGLTDVTATLLLEPTRFFNNEVFQCSITHPAFPNVKTLNYRANVTYAPVSLQITANKENTLLTCHADGNPPVKYDWRLPGDTTNEGPTVNLLSPDEPSHLNDTYICYAENAMGRSSVNVTTYQATKIVALNEPINPGLIAGVVIGAIAFIVVVVALIYFFYFKRFREEDKGPYMKRSSLVRQSTDSYSRPMIQHSNDVLNLNRPPSPQHPPPDDDHDRDNDSSTDEDGQDVDLTSRVVEPARYEEPPIETEITSRSSMNFRAKRQRPSASGSRRSRTETKQPEELHRLSNMRYDLPPSDNYTKEQEFDNSRSPEEYRSSPHQQPQYVGYPRTQRYSRDSPQTRETTYTEIDHSSFTPDDRVRREPYEEPVEYAQIVKGHSALV